MKINVSAEVTFDVQYKDVMGFLQEEKLTQNQYDSIIQECMKLKKGFFTIPDQQKLEIFQQYKDSMTAEEMEQRLTFKY
jgi:hypothetical protein